MKIQRQLSQRNKLCFAKGSAHINIHVCLKNKFTRSCDKASASWRGFLATYSRKRERRRPARLWRGKKPRFRALPFKTLCKALHSLPNIRLHLSFALLAPGAALHDGRNRTGRQLRQRFTPRLATSHARQKEVQVLRGFRSWGAQGHTLPNSRCIASN